MGLDSNSTAAITGYDSNCFELRSQVDGILVGTKTVLVDDPSLIKKYNRS